MKREKYPPLKPWQLEVVKKHETRRRLTNGTPYDQTKYRYMIAKGISEDAFDADAQSYEKTIEFKSTLRSLQMRAAIIGAAEEFRRCFKFLLKIGGRP